MSEARILTADEIHQLPRTAIVWVEFFNAEEGEATSLLAAMKCADGTFVDEDACIYDDIEADMKPNQEGWWRFWSARPSISEREEVPWQ